MHDVSPIPSRLSEELEPHMVVLNGHTLNLSAMLVYLLEQFHAELVAYVQEAVSLQQ